MFASVVNVAVQAILKVSRSKPYAIPYALLCCYHAEQDYQSLIAKSDSLQVLHLATCGPI